MWDDFHHAWTLPHFGLGPVFPYTLSIELRYCVRLGNPSPFPHLAVLEIDFKAWVFNAVCTWAAILELTFAFLLLLFSLNQML